MASNFLPFAKSEGLNPAFVIMRPAGCCEPPEMDCYENNGCYELPYLSGGPGIQTFARLTSIPTAGGVFPLSVVNCESGATAIPNAGTLTVSLLYPVLAWINTGPLPALPPGRYAFSGGGYCSTPFRAACGACYATYCQWFACDNAMGYPYEIFTVKPYFQSLPLPLWFHSPFAFEESKVDTDSNGFTRKRYARVQKKWKMETDALPPFALEALQLAVSHGVFVAEVREYPLPVWRGLTAEAALEIESPEQNPPPLYRTAKGTFVEGRYSKFTTFCDPCLET